MDKSHSDLKGTAVWKPHSVHWRERGGDTTKFVGEIHAMKDNDPSISIRSMATDIGVSFLSGR